MLKIDKFFSNNLEGFWKTQTNDAVLLMGASDPEKAFMCLSRGLSQKEHFVV